MSYSDDSFSSSRSPSSSSRASSRSPPRRTAAAAAPVSSPPVTSSVSPQRGAIDATRLRQALASSATRGSGASPQEKSTPLKKGAAATRKPSESISTNVSPQKYVRRSYSASSSSSSYSASSSRSSRSSSRASSKGKRAADKSQLNESNKSKKKKEKHSEREVDDESPSALRAQHANLLREVQAMEVKLRRTRQLDAIVATSAVANRQYNAYNPFSQKAVEQRIKRLGQEVLAAEQENERLTKKLNTYEDLDRLHVQIAKREEDVRNQQLTNQRLQRQIRDNSRALAGKTGHDKINEVAVAADRDRRRAMEAAKRSVASAAQEAATAAEGRAAAQEKLQQMLQEDPFADLGQEDVTRLISLRRELVEAREYDEQLEARLVAVRRQRSAEESAAYPDASAETLNALHKLRLEVSLLQIRAGLDLTPWGLPGAAVATAAPAPTSAAKAAHKEKPEVAAAAAVPSASAMPAAVADAAASPAAAKAEKTAAATAAKPVNKGASSAVHSNAVPDSTPPKTTTTAATNPPAGKSAPTGGAPKSTAAAGAKTSASTAGTDDMAPLRTPRGSMAAAVGAPHSNGTQPAGSGRGVGGGALDFARAERERRQREDAEAAAASARLRESAQASLHASRQGAADAVAMAAAARRQREQEDREAAEALERLRKRRSTTGTAASSDAEAKTLDDSSDTGAGRDKPKPKGAAAVLSPSALQPHPPANGAASTAVTSPRRNSDLAAVSGASDTTGELAAAAARRKAEWLRERVDRLEADEEAARAELRRGWDNTVLYTLTPAHRDVTERAKRAKAAPSPPPPPVVVAASDVPSWLDD